MTDFTQFLDANVFKSVVGMSIAIFILTQMFKGVIDKVLQTLFKVTTPTDILVYVIAIIISLILIPQWTAINVLLSLINAGVAALASMKFFDKVVSKITKGDT